MVLVVMRVMGPRLSPSYLYSDWPGLLLVSTDFYTAHCSLPALPSGESEDQPSQRQLSAVRQFLIKIIILLQPELHSNTALQEGASREKIVISNSISC